MTNLLLNLFLKNTPEEKQRGAIGTLSGVVGIACNLLLFALKTAVGTLAHSVSITADAMNNLSDASSSIVTVLGFRFSQMPADEEHPYGHARFEYLSGLAVASMILIIGFELAKTSAGKILHPESVEFSVVTVFALLMSIGVKLWLSVFNRTLGEKIQSTAILATSADSRNDCIATGAVLIAGVIEYFTKLRIDGWMGMAVALFILYSGWNLAKDTISPLLGEAASPELQETIVDYISRQPKVLGYHDLMVHDYGPGRRFASLHVEMDMREDPLVCHELIDDMERECRESHGIHLVIHYDPVVTDDPELNEKKQAADAVLKGIDERLSLHDFRMVRGQGHTNLIFDVAVPIPLRGQEKQIRKALEEKLNEGSKVKYYLVLTFDTAM